MMQQSGMRFVFRSAATKSQIQHAIVAALPNAGQSWVSIGETLAQPKTQQQPIALAPGTIFIGTQQWSHQGILTVGHKKNQVNLKSIDCNI